MDDSATPPFAFATAAGLPLLVAFDGGRLTSESGLPWLAEADAALGLCQALAAGVPDWRRGPVTHALETLIRQRVFQIACGYADRLSDHRFWANQFRLFLHAGVPQGPYWLLDTVRTWLVAAGAPRPQLDTLRLQLLKIGGRVYQLRTHVRLALASGHPGQALWTFLAPASSGRVHNSG